MKLEKWPISSVAGILVVIAGWSYILTAIALYPGPFSPIVNYLSDLGYYKNNPIGAYVYNVGIIITAFIFSIFFIGLQQFYPEATRARVFFRLLQITGFLFIFSMIMVAIYSEDTMAEHLLWSIILFFFGFLANIFGGLFLLTQSDSIKEVAYSNLIVAASHIILILALDPSFTIIEWIITIISHINLLLIVYNYKHMWNLRTNL